MNADTAGRGGGWARAIREGTSAAWPSVSALSPSGRLSVQSLEKRAFIRRGIVTYVPRWLPLFFLFTRTLPDWLIDWLDFIPAAVLSALILPALITTGDPKELQWMKADLWVAIPTLMFALRTKSLAGTVIVGMVLY